MHNGCVRPTGYGARRAHTCARRWAVLRRHGVDAAALELVLELPSNKIVRSAVEAGAGIAVLSAVVVAPSIAAGKLHAVSFDLGVRAFYGLRHKERYRGKAANALLDLIQDEVKSCYT